MKKPTFETGEKVRYKVATGWAIGEVACCDAETGTVTIRTRLGKLALRPASSVQKVRVAAQPQEQPPMIPLLQA